MTNNNLDSKCNPIMNGYVCNVTNDNLNDIKESFNLKSSIERNGIKSQLTLTDQKGEWFGNAIKIKDSNIRLFTKKQLM